MRADVKPELLRWTRERASMDIDALVHRFPKYAEWERGTVRPTLKQLEKLARTVHAPVGFFFLSRPLHEPVGTCLRLIECEPDAPVWYPDELQDRVYDFWDVARQDIWNDWMRETDPVNLQPRIRPLNLRVAEFIRAHVPPGMDQGQVNRALDILESP